MVRVNTHQIEVRSSYAIQSQAGSINARISGNRDRGDQGKMGSILLFSRQLLFSHDRCRLSTVTSAQSERFLCALSNCKCWQYVHILRGTVLAKQHPFPSLRIFKCQFATNDVKSQAQGLASGQLSIPGGCCSESGCIFWVYFW